MDIILSSTFPALFAIFIFAAMVRGFSGFGFTLVALPLSALFMPVIELVPVFMLIDLLGNVQLLPKVRRHVDWKWVAKVFIPCFVFTPVGLLLLKSVEQDTIVLIISVFIFASALMIQKGFQYSKEPKFAPFILGSLAGVMNGAASMSGPPVGAHALASPVAPHIARAGLIAFFVLADSSAFVSASIAGLVNSNLVILTAALLPSSMLGGYLGSQLFERYGGKKFKPVTVILLITIAIFSILRVI
ncbi:sulfite exporter TauE/SafE family protein [Vibrio gallaecicus]|uniref:Probable membrane transporter protein n=1 Tax=Vibrio gallaecicus TaxID=552386 RepID=A0ABV4N9P0_9VIBR